MHVPFRVVARLYRTNAQIFSILPVNTSKQFGLILATGAYRIKQILTDLRVLWLCRPLFSFERPCGLGSVSGSRHAADASRGIGFPRPS
jgi:hypothetical protein